MKPVTAEWISKAEGDFEVAERECRARKNPNYDAVCFHYQQCAEKYLKAVLCESDISFGKIHDLVVLLEQALAVAPHWEILREDIAYLSDFSVSFRYPGESAGKETAKEARKRCRQFRETARTFPAFREVQR
jgi:HEPN domain-containing protein